MVAGITYRREIDGLRAIAVSAVVLYHAGIGGAGFVGVDVFFVISGYLITALLLREGQIDLVAFYARRVRRIFPAAAVVILAVLAASFLLLPVATHTGVKQSAAAAAVFAANVYFQSLTSGYFNADTGQLPLLHLWSLSVEEQFYLLWPALLIWTPRHRLVPALVVLALASFVLSEWLMLGNPQAAFYQAPARFWELAAGGIIAALPARPLHRYAAPAGVLLTVAACIWPLGHFPGVGALPAVLGACLLIAAVHGGASNALLGSRPFVGLGLISYSLYLWHWPLLAFDRLLRVGPSPWEARAASVLAALVLAFASYRYIEQPFRKLRWPRGRTVGYGVAVMAFIACSAWTWGPLGTASPLAVPVATFMKCHPYRAGQGSLVQPASCVGRERKVVIWGDSYALSWAPLAQAFADRLHVPAVILGRYGCPPMPGADLTLSGPVDARNCAKWNADALAYLQANGADTLILTARWQNFIGADGGETSAAALSRAVAVLSPHVRRILIIAPTPEFTDMPQKCAELGSDCAVSRASFEQQAAASWTALRAIDEPKLTITDPVPWLCTATSCPIRRGGEALYNDKFHVSEYTSLLWGKRVAADWN